MNAATKPAGQAGKKIEVDDFLITGAKVHVSLSGIGGKEMSLPLPDIHLTNLGKDKNGITAADLTRRVLDTITTATIKAVANATTDIGTGAGKAAGEGMNKITPGIGGLFKKSTN
jgi:hypothetical protein